MKVMRNGDQVTVESDGKMSNSGYHRCAKPTWWMRYTDLDHRGDFIAIPRVRGDERLVVTVTLPRHATETRRITIGCGPRDSRDSVRESMRIMSAEEAAAKTAAAAK